MVDMDFKNGIAINGIKNSLNQKNEWDAICANGITKKGTYYDSYALRDKELPFGPEIEGETWWRLSGARKIVLKQNHPLIPVYSAFGGLAIYKRSSIKNCHYSGIVTSQLENFVKQIIFDKPSHPQVVRYLNMDHSIDSFYRISPEVNSIKWSLNSGGYEVPVCCEHVAFHAMMIANGHTKIFINPNMVVRY